MYQSNHKKDVLIYIFMEEKEKIRERTKLQ